MQSQSNGANWPRAARNFQADDLDVRVYGTLDDLAADAALEVNAHLRAAIKEKGSAAVILATGNSQIQFLKKLVALEGVDWSKVTLFHIDEYLRLNGASEARSGR